MTGTLLLASAHSNNSLSIPSPLTILVAVAAVAWVLWSRMKGQPLKARRLLALPVVLIVIGATSLGRLSGAAVVFLVISLALSVTLGAARGATIELYPNQGELWQRYRLTTVALWVALIVAKVVLIAVAAAANASAGGGTNSLLVTLGASLAAEAAVVGPRALSTGLPFAVEKRDGEARRPAASRFVDAAPPPPGFTDRQPDGEAYRPAAPGDGGGQWRSPGWREGAQWLRRQVDQAATDRMTTSDSRRDRAGHKHHDHGHSHEDHHR